MSKKWIISLSVIFGIIAIMLILFWTLFGLSSVSVSFDSTLKNLTVSQEEIVEAGEFKKHVSVLFENKKKYIEKIYNKASEIKNFAYIKISNIETVFPNKFVIHITEREELFAIKYNDQFLICDRDLRVLKILEDFTSYQDNPILINNLQILNQQIQVGDFLDVAEASIKKLYSAFLQNNRNLSQILGKFKEMNIFTYEDSVTLKEYYGCSLTTFSGQKFDIYNIDFALPQKIQLMFAVESALYSQVDEFGNVLSNNQPVLITQNQFGEFVPSQQGQPLTVDMLKNCTIKVDNLTITEYTPRTEKDIYYALIGINI